ncbi:DNA mismatch repair protein MutS [Allobacillus sp. GCM10007491]|uniref:DNA mismatch repair protein MutS n=1 Tax=Allobacillus saliphilus TaxID=2912308 RepID=A0A941CSM9_9BACI|nr:DNA mismatch repair protein MutS [Allobacillus saliphilus]MBR7552964.1 DNA mismatch repair protein MutS [Allobacillus saliphilus]
MTTYTPMMQQYLNIKSEYKDEFLFFRLGDFYELFFDDALKAAKELEITLTQRVGGKEDKIPMCGVPYHSAENYIKTLVDRGYKVAICEQVEDPKMAKGVVKREVIQVITPGTIMEGNMLKENENNYLASLYLIEDDFIVSYVDLSTGESFVSKVNGKIKDVIGELYNRPVKEVVLPTDFPEDLTETLTHYLDLTLSSEHENHIPEEFQKLVTGLDDTRFVRGFGYLFQYIYRSQKRFLAHLQAVQFIELDDYMKLDLYSKRNLELIESLRDQSKKGTLLSVLDKTITAMGSRLLKKWIDRPLLSKDQIAERHQQVHTMMEHFMERDELRESLKNVYDLERLAGRISYGNVNARDLLQLKRSLGALPQIKQLLNLFDHPSVSSLLSEVESYQEIFEILDAALAENPPVLITEGNLIKDGYHKQLDEYREVNRNGKNWIAELEAKEREETGIRSLKVGFNKVFGYYIEVTRANLPHLAENRYERKQTLANAERFVTPELKEKERMILEAEEKSTTLEYELFLELRDQIKSYIPALQTLAEQISKIDCLLSFAIVSEENNYTKPMLNDEQQLRIREGRHPVVEQVMKEMFVPNDIQMDETTDILLITGPNMAGKSTYMRQIALMIIMNQIGCFVPASEAEMPVFDQIFTRIGAADDLVSGQSTFMVEMMEAEHAVRHATERSFILLDEIGRGTSTYDGMALAQSIVEYIHQQVGAKTLFSTHYHELTSLDKSLSRLRNVHVEVDEEDGEVVFLHHIKEGKADKSYGIHVAKLADLPEDIIQRAYQLLDSFEATSVLREEEPQEQLTLFEEDQGTPTLTANIEVIERLKKANLMKMTPMDAMNLLYQLKENLE